MDQQQRYEKDLGKNVDFYRLFSGNADKAMADRCMAVLEEMIAEPPSLDSNNYEERCVSYVGERRIIERIKKRIARGREQAHENT